MLNLTGTIKETQIYYVQKGSLRIYLEDEQEEHTIRFGYANNLIVSLDSFLTDKPSELYIQALKETQLKIIHKTNFLNILSSNKQFKNTWTTILEGVVLQQLEREKDILTTSPIARYRRVLKRSPQLFQEIPSKHIAAYLRMSPETLSRIKKS